MNYDELASLLAATHKSPPRPRTDLRHSLIPAPLSPRQTFQSRVRGSGNNDIAKDEAQKILNEYKPPIPLKSKSRTSPQVSSRAAATSKNTTSLITEPDFVVEERAAWTKSGSGLFSPHSNDDFILIPSSNESSESATDTELIPFGPTFSDNAEAPRPKTSRGKSHIAEHVEPTAETTPSHSSKFQEGSMNARSIGVSSTWDTHGQRLSLDITSDDSDGTIKAARPSTDSISSTDISEFRPGVTTPATLKQRLSRFASSLKPVGEQDKVNVEEPKPKRKGLRKSMSMWGLQKIFGSSNEQEQQSNASQTHLEALNDRKRKAEEVYEQQFGTKKQKANDGQSVDDPNCTVRGPPRTLRKRDTSANRTITPATKRRRQVSSSTVIPADPADSEDADETEGDIDRQKRPSRRELEKENHQLRALLREQQAQSRASLHLAASRSSSHLPLDSSKPVAYNKTPARKTARSYVPPNAPPVPPLPERAVLSNMTNKTFEVYSPDRARDTRKDTGTVKRVGRMPQLQGRVGEGDENKSPLIAGEEWKWPDDVF